MNFCSYCIILYNCLVKWSDLVGQSVCVHPVTDWPHIQHPGHPTLLNVKVFYWHRWFHEESLIEPFHCTIVEKSSLD